MFNEIIVFFTSPLFLFSFGLLFFIFTFILFIIVYRTMKVISSLASECVGTFKELGVSNKRLTDELMKTKSENGRLWGMINYRTKLLKENGIEIRKKKDDTIVETDSGMVLHGRKVKIQEEVEEFIKKNRL